jgi:hypothetical protein
MLPCKITVIALGALYSKGRAAYSVNYPHIGSAGFAWQMAISLPPVRWRLVT